jgi:hypothetical protein
MPVFVVLYNMGVLERGKTRQTEELQPDEAFSNSVPRTSTCIRNRRCSNRSSSFLTGKVVHCHSTARNSRHVSHKGASRNSRAEHYNFQPLPPSFYKTTTLLDQQARSLTARTQDQILRASEPGTKRLKRVLFFILLDNSTKRQHHFPSIIPRQSPCGPMARSGSIFDSTVPKIC